MERCTMCRCGWAIERGDAERTCEDKQSGGRRSESPSSARFVSPALSASPRSSPSFEADTDARQEADRVVVVHLLKNLIGQGQAAELRLPVVRQVRVVDRRGADVGSLPEFAVGPPAAGEEVEAAVVAAD